MRVGVAPSLLNKNNSLVISDKVNREKDTFKLNINIRGSIDW